MQAKLLTVAETAIFSRQAEKIWSEDKLFELVDFIARNPESGVIVPDTGGVRKLRWAREGGGKRGGARVIYFYYHSDAPIYLLMAYAKAKREDMTPEEKRAVAALTMDLKRRLSSKARAR
jgi:hypothetical protein